MDMKELQSRAGIITEEEEEEEEEDVTNLTSSWINGNIDYVVGKVGKNIPLFVEVAILLNEHKGMDEMIRFMQTVRFGSRG